MTVNIVHYTANMAVMIITGRTTPNPSALCILGKQRIIVNVCKDKYFEFENKERKLELGSITHGN